MFAYKGAIGKAADISNKLTIKLLSVLLFLSVLKKIKKTRCKSGIIIYIIDMLTMFVHSWKTIKECTYRTENKLNN